jgi:heptosyltransferase-2
MRILVIQTAFLGDVILTTPFLMALRSKYPEGSIDVVATPQGCEVLQGLNQVRCHAIDKKRGLRAGLTEVLNSLNGDPFDLVFSVHRSPRSLWLGRKAKTSASAKRIAFSSFWSKILGYKTVSYPPYNEETHYAAKPMALLQAIWPGDPALKAHLKRPKLEVLEADHDSVSEKLRDLKKYFVLSPFSVWGTKMWFADRYARLGVELARKYHVPIVITGSSNATERVIGTTIVEKIVAAGGQALSLAGMTSIGELKALIRGAELVVANDSAPVHIASAFNVPTVAIFGPTVKKWGFFPLADRNVVVERQNLSCRPCHIHGPQRCPKRHFRCMDEIQVEDVAQAVKQLL